MKFQRIRFLLIPVVSLVATTAMAGECREALRPLMLQTPLNQPALREVQVLCTAEAEAGDADALYQSALLHLGLLDWDADKAIPMIESAAHQGVPEAQYWMAWQYEEGPLLPNDAQRALHWYELAGDSEHRLALGRLADAYENGELGLTANAIKAIGFRARVRQCKDKNS